MSLPVRLIQFDQIAVPSAPDRKRRWPRLAEVRYRKDIHEHDVDRATANYTKSALVGALAGLASRAAAPRLHRAAIGAGAGLVAQNIIRQVGSHHDYYGDRSLASKRAEKLPIYAGLATAGVLGYKRLKGLKLPHVKFSRLEDRQGRQGREGKKKLCELGALRGSFVPKRLVEFRDVSRVGDHAWRPVAADRGDDLSRQRKKLAFYGGVAALGAGGLALALRKTGNDTTREPYHPGAFVRTMPPGRGTVDRIAKANSIRQERGYVHLRPVKRKVFDKLPMETQKLAGQIKHVATDTANISAAERKIARAAFGKLRGLKKFSRLQKICHLEPVERSRWVSMQRDHTRFHGVSPLRCASVEMTARGRAIFFGGRQQMRDDNNRFVDPLGVAAGLQSASIRHGDGSYSPVDIPISHAQVLRSAYRRGKQIKRTGSRVGNLLRDTGDVISGSPRRRDELGRPKRREWEKSYFKDAVASAATGAAVLGGAAYLRANPHVRDDLIHRVSKITRKINARIPDLFPTRHFNEPQRAQRTLSFSRFARLRDLGDLRGKIEFSPLPAKFGGKINYAMQDEFFRARQAAGKPFRKGLVIRPDAKRLAKLKLLSAGINPTTFAIGEDEPYGVIDKHTGQIIHKTTWAKRKFARRVADRNDLKYGAVRFLPRLLTTEEALKPAIRSAMSHVRLSHTPVRFLQFDFTAPSWDVRDERGRSARVFAPGARRRFRRDKEWHEEVGNQRKILGALALAGTAGGIAIGRYLIPKKAKRLPFISPKSSAHPGYRPFNPDI